jgi:GDP-L-fucose synthase
MIQKILITGADGLVGTALKDIASLYKNKYQFIFINRNIADLTKENEVKAVFDTYKPDYVIHAAARVGGIGRNLNSPAKQFTDNILMNTHVIHQCYTHNVKKLIAFSSVCAFPKTLDVITEDKLQDGEPYEAHFSYAYSKRMVDIQIQSYIKQYNVNYCSVIPGNIFGENDNFNLEDGHVVPSLIHKLYLAKNSSNPFIVWGDGSSTREFIYAKDLALICIKMLDEIEQLPLRLIVSGKEEMSIKNLVQLICDQAQYDNVVYDTTKPNGQKRRPTDHTLFNSIFKDFSFTPLDKALKKTYNWFSENYNEARK